MLSGFYKIKEKIFKQIFLLQDYAAVFSKWAVYVLKFVFALYTLIYLVHIFIHIGFSDEGEFYQGAEFYNYIFYGLFLSRYIPEILSLKKRNHLRWVIDISLFIAGIAIAYTFLRNEPGTSWFFRIFGNFVVLNTYIILLIVAELHRLFRLINSLKITPALLFSVSFLVVILVGSGLLMMPNAQATPISYLDALFTSASAVCVTGLVVVDTSVAFTDLGRIIILGLIQVGGLGIMTFTVFFGYIFTGSASYKDSFILKEILSSDTMSGLFRALIQIVAVTFLIEIFGAVLIYFSMDEPMQNQILFSVFHSISAFCNAGFSTLSAGLASPEIEGNHSLQLIIATLIVLGGIGFPVLLGLINYFIYISQKLNPKMEQRSRKRVKLSSNSVIPIVLITTVFLLIVGTLGYFLLERSSSLNEMSTTDQVFASFFGSVSARTAGFNIVDITKWSYPTIFLMIFLMWVGASPGSTGGGIKTTTFFIAMKATVDFIRGNKSVEIWNRELGGDTVLRILVVIFLSVLVIFLGFFILLIFEPGKNPADLLFECFSAYGTVGLSTANTATFCNSGKITVIVLMFIGRIGPLTILTGLFISGKQKYYRYPKKDFIIN